MSNSDFEPKLGKPKSTGTIESGRLVRRVVKAAAKHRGKLTAPWANALTKRPVAELGRGKGALYGIGPSLPGRRRVIVKVRIARHGTSDLAAARSHLHYIQRDGVTPDGGAGVLYGREHDRIDAGPFLDRQADDTYQFRLIVAPEDGAKLEDLKPFVRDLMTTMEQDLHTRLDWVAVDHFNTGHPHTHIVIAGHDDQDQDLVIARHYISHGIRERARDLVTMELGPETEIERVVKQAREMTAERLTALDRGLLNRARENVLVLSASPEEERGRQALHLGRLRHLARMGLAEEKQAGVWALDDRLDTKLRRLGERGDIMLTMNRVLRRQGIDRAAGDVAIFSGASKNEPVLGKVVEVGFVDEMTDWRFLVVDGLDGRLHYAETRPRAAHELPEPGMIVALSGGGKGRTRNAQIEIVSYQPLERLPTVEAATWLDKVIVADVRPVLREKGFGAEVSTALVARESWLIERGHAVAERPGTITPRPRLLRELDRQAFARAIETLSTELGRPYVPPLEGVPVTGRHVRTIDLPTRRFAVIAGRDEFTVIPWRPELARLRGHDIAVRVHDQAITLSLARGRDLGLSR